ncbi:MAG: hypothetical protein QXK89_07320 [Candidatus Bathyarchaeia archaeon]
MELRVSLQKGFYSKRGFIETITIRKMDKDDENDLARKEKAVHLSED